MSRDLVTLVYSRKTGSMLRKSVLTAMADRANDDGTGIWLSKQRIADEIEASRQGVVNAIKSLLSDGLLIEVGERACSNGWTMEYSISVPVVCALPVRAQHVGDPPKYVGVQNANTPPHPVDPTPQPDGGDSPTPFTQTVLNRPEPTAKAVKGATPEKPKRKAAPKGAARGSRIAPNWAPTPKDYAFASSAGLTTEEINREADRFRNYWLAATKNAAKCDWEATWRNWLTGEYGIVTKKRAALDRGNAASGTSFAGVAASMEGHTPQSANSAWSDGPTIEGEFTYAEADAGDSRSNGSWGSDRADAATLLAGWQRRAG